MLHNNKIKRAQNLLGTYVEITAYGLPREVLHIAVQGAFSAVAKIHTLMSFHEPSSDISKINGARSGEIVPIDPWTHEVLAIAQHICFSSRGIFNPAIGDVLQRWGILPGGENVADPECPRTLHDIKLLSDSRVCIEKTITVDLGGIAKGFAVDKAVEALLGADVRAGIVNAGGDLRVFGEIEEPISLRIPTKPGAFLQLGNIRDEAIATSSNEFTLRRYQDEIVGPLVHGVTRKAMIASHSFSVRASSCVVADALTKVIAHNDHEWEPLLKELHATAYKIDGGEIFTLNDRFGASP